MIELFTRLVTKSLWVRRERLLISVIAVMLGAAMVTSLLTISLDIREKMGQELRSYGANLVVLPGEGEYIDQFNATHSSIIGSVPILYFKVEVNKKKIEFAGADLEAAKKMNPWWHVEGVLPEQEEVLSGINAANKLGLRTGDMLSIGEKSFKVSGILDTGTSDDNRIFIPMETAERISGKSGATLVLVSVLGDIDDVIKYLENKNYKVKKIRQVAESEKALLDKARRFRSHPFNLNQKERTRFRRENIGLVFQQFHMIPHLTALENVMIAQYFHSIEDEGEAKEALVHVGMEHRLHHMPSQLSGGEQQRVCIAMALINQPQIILADEPTGNLDKKNEEAVLDIFRELHSEGRTIVIVTHNPEIGEIGDKIIQISHGEVKY